MRSIDLSGRVAVITGGGQGLGAATANLLYEAGASVAVNYLDEPSGANRERAANTAARWGDRGFIAPADVREQGQIEQFLDAVSQRFGGIDFVVNNAAVIRDRSLRKMTEEEWQTVVDTNLTGVFHVCRAAQSRLRPGGRIVNLASISGVIGFYGQLNYSAAKAGVIAMTKVLAKEFAANRITVNAVAPGVVLTEMGQTIPDAVREQMLSQIPLGRFGEPEEIGKVILFLCSDLADYVTGQTIHVNGGWWAA